MGQEHSAPTIEDDTPCQSLNDRSIESVARYIKDGRAKKIVVLVGAGISTSAGIPDFRSPDTGLYANLAKLDLPFAEAVFDISYFRSNPLPFYTLAHELYPGKYRPTLSHSFVRLLSDKGLLLKLFTQNIDCLDRAAGVPVNKIVEAHGSFAHHHCIECKSPFPEDLMKRAINEAEVPHCLTPQCNGLVKPDIVFFGEQLPEEFHRSRSLPSTADLCIVMGTSLSVQPFGSLPSFCERGVPRVLINLERAGGLGSRTDDVLVLGDCDAGVRKLAAALGWESELEALWKNTAPSNETFDQGQTREDTPKTENQKLDDKIAIMTEEIGRSLKISSELETRVRVQLAKEKKENAKAREEEGREAEADEEVEGEEKDPSANLATRTELMVRRNRESGSSDYTDAEAPMNDSKPPGRVAHGPSFTETSPNDIKKPAVSY